MVTILRSDDMACLVCAGTIEKTLKALDGVEDARVHVTTGRIEVRYDPHRTSAADLITAVQASGYNARVGTRS